MSQSIPEQLNVDRREFADAVNALTKICSSHLVGSGAGIFSSAIPNAGVGIIRDVSADVTVDFVNKLVKWSNEGKDNGNGLPYVLCSDPVLSNSCQLSNDAQIVEILRHKRALEAKLKPNWSSCHQCNPKRGILSRQTSEGGATTKKSIRKKAVIDSGCSRYMTGNKCYLDEYEDCDGGFISFGDGKGKISGKVPRKDNIYSVDLKSVIPTGDLTCLIAKATIDKSNTWHRRLGHINFKTMNKLVKGNLVKGLPSKIFANDHSCVACQKGKSLDDFSRFFRCDNGTEFKNSIMNQFCEMKRVKREFSVARTPQQNGVIMPHNKTPYDLFVDDSTDRLLETFGCQSYILIKGSSRRNLMEKLMRGYFVRYSVVVRNGPDWLFDVDSLTISMNYVPVVTGNQTNGIVGTKDNIVAGQAQKEKDPEQEYILIPLCTTNPLISQGPKDSEGDAGMNPTEVDERGASDKNEKDDKITRNLFERFFSFQKCLFTFHCSSNVSLMDNTGIFGNAYDDEDLEEEVDMNNVISSYLVPDTSFTKFHKDHPEDQVEAMQDKLLQFKLLKVWTLVDLPRDKWAIGTKWVYRKRGEEIVVEEPKLGLVIFGLCIIYGVYCIPDECEECLFYGTIEEEVYVCQPPGFEDSQFPDNVYKVEKALYGLHQAPRAWYETLSTYLIENRFRRGTIDKTLFIKKDKGLQVQQKKDGIFISQDKYVVDILKKFDFITMKIASTPTETNKALIKDEEAKNVDVYLYRSMIGSLMYLTTSRPDIMFAVCACARFQVTPKTSHLHVVKRIFRYLKGQPKLGLWYPRDSPFDLEAFSDSDYAGASLDRKSTTGGCQFLSKRLISWQCKKQNIVANSTTKVEYVAAANCCGHVLWI
ncbi:putative ribonuclease H-like domain-containing protein [Tanacetum coccineum]